VRASAAGVAGVASPLPVGAAAHPEVLEAAFLARESGYRQA
jgi:hypothetical protein